MSMKLTNNTDWPDHMLRRGVRVRDIRAAQFGNRTTSADARPR